MTNADHSYTSHYISNPGIPGSYNQKRCGKGCQKAGSAEINNGMSAFYAFPLQYSYLKCLSGSYGPVKEKIASLVTEKLRQNPGIY